MKRFDRMKAPRLHYRRRWLLALSACLAVSGGSTAGVNGIVLLEHRAEFELIDPSLPEPAWPDASAARPHATSAAACQWHSITLPGPGLLRVGVLVSPWFRNTHPIRFRTSASKADTSDSSAPDRIPGLDHRHYISQPAQPMEGCALRWIESYELPATATERRPAAIDVGICPSTLQFPGGTVHQYRNAVEVHIEWFPTGNSVPELDPLRDRDNSPCSDRPG